jgi:ubiquinone/menaquinone biosynthesis C-methylase UbiE
VEGLTLANKAVSDVSCGRGGGLAYLAREFQPASAHGFDFTPVNVALCKSAFPAFSSAPDLRFAVGSALDIPLEDGSVDVLLSVEASHCYASTERFLAEARRVLRDDGVLVWTDFERADAALPKHRFAHVDEVDITDHVLRAMRADRERRRALIRAHSAQMFWNMLDHFAGSAEHVDTVRRFAERRSRYFLRRMRGRA